MKQKTISVATTTIISVSVVSFLMVSLMAMADPRLIMDMVKTDLRNTDAFSSVRGVYGGVGISLTIVLIFLFRNNKTWALGLLSLIWGMYVVSRTITIFIEGPLGDFGKQWLATELLLFIFSVVLYYLNKNCQVRHNQRL